MLDENGELSDAIRMQVAKAAVHSLTVALRSGQPQALVMKIDPQNGLEFFKRLPLSAVDWTRAR